jgi:hypothetical protein
MGSQSACLRLSPLGALARGLVAGAAGTMAMDLLWFIRAHLLYGATTAAVFHIESGTTG